MILKNLTFQVFIAALAGILCALVFSNESWLVTPAPAAYELILLLKGIFLSALKMLIAPMIFFSLVGGVSGIGDVIRLRRLGGVTIAYYLTTTGLAITLGLIAVFFIHPWTGSPPSPELANGAKPASMIAPGDDSIVHVLSQLANLALTNPFKALVNLNILGIVTNALLIGVAMVLVLPDDSPVFKFVEDVNAVIFRVLGWVIRIMPIGIFAILFDFTVKLHLGKGESTAVVEQLLEFGALVIVLTLVHGTLVLPGIAWLFARKNPRYLFPKILRPMIVAFSTSSSSATLPVSMKTCEEELGVSNSVASFVLPLGATMNMDGTALFEAVAAVFLAYLFGIHLSSVAIVTVFLM
ncbi:MAG TPA: dicarboxylate/amino acid:cation symporter, partial [Pseudomonadales bacterium]|nr:dicarboxylate/amino acid:cation symporter [Pseudomonadales bacterium]